jgi:hypothetical protein
MNSFSNIDLLSVGVAIAANILIGFAAYLSNKKSATHKLFFVQTIILSVWSLMNYISYQPFQNSELNLYLVRLVLFFAVPNSVVFLILMHTFPSQTIRMHRNTLILLLSVMACVMVITLTPLLFKGILINETGAPIPIPNVGLIPFVIVAVISLPIGVFYLVKNYINASTGREEAVCFFNYWCYFNVFTYNSF